MGFKMIKHREIILIAIAGFLIFMAIVSSLRAKSIDVPNTQIQEPVLPQPSQQPVVMASPTPVAGDLEDEAVLNDMKDQMDKDRSQQRQIKMLKMQLEQINLQLDNEKALTEINRLKKENAGYVKDPDHQAGADFPNVRIIYIGGTDADREAILSIDGTSYSVKEKDRPVANIEVLHITGQGVKVHFTAPQELTTVINYIQD